jgi:pimeloyl-ACP methyl ester carboxylesterase
MYNCIIKKHFAPVYFLFFILITFGCKSKNNIVSEKEDYLTLKDGTRIFYHVTGSAGDTVVVPMNYWNVEGFKKYISGKTIIFYDPRGRRQSDPIPDDKTYNIGQDLSDLEEVRQLLGIGKMHLIGTSYYGAFIARYAMLYPSHVKSLVLVGSLYPSREPFINYDPPEAANRLDSNEVKRFAEMKQNGMDTINPSAYCEQYWKVNAPSTVGDIASLKTRKFDCDLPNESPKNLGRFGKGVFESLGNWDWTTEAGKITATALIIHGAKDLMVPQTSSEKWASLIKGAKLEILPAAGHIPWWEFEKEVFNLIDSFYKH